MLSSLLLLVLLTAPVVDANRSAGRNPGGPRFDYTVRVGVPEDATVEVALRAFDLPSAEKLVLGLPREFAFVRLEEPLIEGDLLVRNGVGRELEVRRITPFRWSIATEGAEELTARLTVPLRHRELPAVRERDCYEYPYLAEDHGMLVTATMLLVPELPDFRGRVRFELPEGWSVRCPWPEVEPGIFEPTTAGALRNDLIAIGNWRDQAIEVGGCEITVAVAPGQERLLESTGPMIEQIVRAELELFGRVPRVKYLFLFGRPDPPLAAGELGLSLAGSPKTGSMTLQVRGRGPAEMVRSRIGHLIAHEFHHTWTSSDRHTGRKPDPSTLDDLRFVAEGFTDYYAYLVLAREGLIPWETFAGELAAALRECAENPVREELSLVEAGGPRFFEGKGAYSLVYRGGMLLAALIDRHIRAADEERSLDDLMRSVNNDARFVTGGELPTLDDFFGELAELVPAELALHLRELAERRGEIDFATELRVAGVEVTKELRPATLGLRANLDGNRIRDLDPNGLAGRLGLQAGDVLLQVNGVPCENQSDVNRAWRQPVDGRMKLTYERDGERREVDEPIPEVLAVIIESKGWK